MQSYQHKKLFPDISFEEFQNMMLEGHFMVWAELYTKNAELEDLCKPTKPKNKSYWAIKSIMQLNQKQFQWKVIIK